MKKQDCSTCIFMAPDCCLHDKNVDLDVCGDEDLSPQFPLYQDAGDIEFSGDACKWGVSDWYDDAEELITNVIAASNKALRPFSTDWGCCKKELESFRISMDESLTYHIEVYAFMDDGTDLVYDALPDGHDMSHDQAHECVDEYILCDCCYEATADGTLPHDATIEDIKNKLDELSGQAHGELDSMFEIMKEIVKAKISTKNESAESARPASK